MAGPTASGRISNGRFFRLRSVIPENWLVEFNEKMAREGVEHVARPFRALLEWSRVTGSTIEFGSPESDAVFQWFYAHSPPGSHNVLPAFIGALFYDAAFWPIEVPLGYGTYRLDGRQAARSMPDPVWASMCRSRHDLAVFIELWADCLDYAYGITEILAPTGAESDWRKFLASADKELRSTTQLLCQTRPSPKAIESARMATEMALKTILCRTNGVTAAFVKQHYGHNLMRLLDAALQTGVTGLEAVKNLLGAFPVVDARYDGVEYPGP